MFVDSYVLSDLLLSNQLKIRGSSCTSGKLTPGLTIVPAFGCCPRKPPANSDRKSQTPSPPMSPLSLLLLAVAAAPLASAASGATPNGAANDLLPKYGLPKGLIPDSVSSYSFDETTGDFEIHLAGTCYVWFGDHLVYYEKNIRGCLSPGKITGLSGIQAKKLFLWVSVSGMVAHPNDGTLEFQAGFISEELPASLFDKVPSCGASAGAQLRGVAGVIRELGLLPVAEA